MKAVVVAKNEKRTVLLRDDGHFITMNRQDQVIGDVISLNNLTMKRRLLAIAATAAMFLFLVSAGVFAYATPFYYVSLDINPGLVMEVNRFERVIGLETMNGEAEALLSELEWSNKRVDILVSEIMQELDENGYLEQGSDVLITAAGRNDEKAAELAKRMGRAAEDLELDGADVSSEAVGYEMVQAARDLNMTPGKYNLITRLLGETINESNTKHYQDLSVREIMDQFTATKGVQGKETAAQARDKNPSENSDDGERADGQERAAEARQNAEQRNSEAEETRPEDRQDAQTAENRIDVDRDEITQAAAETSQESAGSQQADSPDPDRTITEATEPLAETPADEIIPDEIIPDATTRR